jgi:tetratricopeptide (TPR) repeat protein
LEIGDLGRADLHIERQHRLAVRLRQPILSWYDLVIRAKRELVAGSLAEADRLAVEGFAAGQEAGQSDAFRWFAAQLFVIRMHQGRLDELVEALEAAPRRIGRSRTVPRLTQAYLATIFIELGREDQARAAYERLMSGDLDDVPYDFAWLPVIALAAAAAVNLGDRPRIEKLISMLTPYRDRYVDMGCSWLGSAAYYLGLLHAYAGDVATAEQCFQDALSAEEALGSRVWIARTKLEHARALRQRGRDEDLDRAAELTEEALESARSLGLGGIVRHAGIAGREGGSLGSRRTSEAD